MLLLGWVGAADEDVAEQPRAEAPMRAYRRHDRVPHPRSRERGAVGVRPVQHQVLNALRKCRGERDGGAASG